MGCVIGRMRGGLQDLIPGMSHCMQITHFNFRRVILTISRHAIDINVTDSLREVTIRRCPRKLRQTHD
jgi:hypothetical protein